MDGGKQRKAVLYGREVVEGGTVTVTSIIYTIFPRFTVCVLMCAVILGSFFYYLTSLLCHVETNLV